MKTFDKLMSHIKTKMKIDETYVNENFEGGGKPIFFTLIPLLFCVFTFIYIVYLFIFQMECIIYNGKKPNGKIDWFGSVIPTFLLFTICGPCMFIYRLIFRCTNKSRNNNVRINNTF